MPCAARAVVRVQRGESILTPLGPPADASDMIAELRRTIEAGDYRVDPGAVAEAMLRRLREPGARSSAVLVPAQPAADAAVGCAQLDAPSFDDAA